MNIHTARASPILVFTMPRSELGAERTARVIAALAGRLAGGPIRLVISTDIWEAVRGELTKPHLADIPHDRPPAERHALFTAQRHDYWQSVRLAYMRRLDHGFEHCAGLVILPRSDGTIGSGIFSEIAAAQARNVPVRVVRPDGHIVPLEVAGMIEAMVEEGKPDLAKGRYRVAAGFTLWGAASRP